MHPQCLPRRVQDGAEKYEILNQEPEHQIHGIKDAWGAEEKAQGHQEHAARAEAWELEAVERDKEAEGFEVLPKRWIVERTFRWLRRDRRLTKDYERKVQTSETLIEVAMIRLILRRLARAASTLPNRLSVPYPWRRPKRSYCSDEAPSWVNNSRDRSSIRSRSDSSSF